MIGMNLSTYINMLRDGADVMITENPNVKRYAIVRDGICEGVTLWDGDVGKWIPPEGSQMVVLEESSTVSGGWSYDGNIWTPPEPLPPLEEIQ